MWQKSIISSLKKNSPKLGRRNTSPLMISFLLLAMGQEILNYLHFFVPVRWTFIKLDPLGFPISFSMLEIGTDCQAAEGELMLSPGSLRGLAPSFCSWSC